MASGGGGGGGGSGGGAPPAMILYGGSNNAVKGAKTSKTANKNANRADQSKFSFNQYNGRPVSDDRSAPSWGNKDARMMARIKYAAELDAKVDIRKVNLEVVKSWIATRITELLGVEDDVVIGFVITQLEEGLKAKEGYVNPKAMQVFLTGFLEKNTSLFMKELWSMLDDAQGNHGIPRSFMQEKQKEVDAAIAAKAERERLADEANEFARKIMQANLKDAARREREKEDKEADEKRERKSGGGDRDRDRDRHRDRDRDRDRHGDRRRDRSRSPDRKHKSKRDRRDRSKSRDCGGERGGDRSDRGGERDGDRGGGDRECGGGRQQEDAAAATAHDGEGGK